MQSTTTLELNLQYPNHATTMHAVQNDRLSRKISAVLVDGTTAWTPPAGSLAVVRFVKPDGTMGFYDTDENDDTAVTWTGNVATITLAEQVLTVAGDVWCQVNFYNASEERLSTFKWLIKVQPCVITDDTIESTDYFNILTQQIAEIMAVISDIPVPSTSNPKMDGTASPGSASGFSRGDHVHPSDTSRVPTSRTVNGKALSSNITLSASDVSAVPTSRTVNSKALSSDITLAASDVGAVPTGRKVNNKALSSDITLSASDVSAFPAVTMVSTSGNLDNYTSAGFYYFSVSQTNIPIGSNGYMLVIPSDSNYVKQVWFRQGTINSNDHQTFIRTCNASSVWSSWHKIYTDVEMCYAVNDTFSTLDNCGYSCFFTNSSKRFSIAVPVDKSLENITTITVTAFSAQIRSQDGYLESNSAVNFISTSGYTVTAVKISNSVVKVTVDKSTAFVLNGTSTSVTNNTLGNVSGTLTLSFT